MKMAPEQVDYLRSRIAPADTAKRREMYLAGDIPRFDKVQDIDARYRWDLLWECVPVNAVTGWYRHLNDTHIDTALRAVVPTLKD